jgi:hypothetical protein
MRKALIMLLALPCLYTACKKDPVRVIDSAYNPDLSLSKFADPTNFTNPYFPLESEKIYKYENQTTAGLEKGEILISTDTKIVQNITCAVVHDRVWLNDILIEDTYDWFAQDNDGNVWYFGEDVKNYNSDGSLLDKDGSWEAGVGSAKAGIIMLANPIVGSKYREEYLFNEAEDEAEIVATGATVTTPAGTFTNCIKTRNFTALEPDIEENKWYAPKFGLVKTLKIPDNETDVLVKTEGGYQVDITLAKFSTPTNLTNQYMVFPVEKKYIYQQVTPDGTERIEIARLGNKVVMGINCIVVKDVVTLNGIKIEETWDWYAQDNEGNIWYFGEDVDNFDHTTGAFEDHHGSWEAGVNGGLPGLIMPATPQVGDQIREEYLWGEAEDEAEVLQTGIMGLVTPYATFDNCIKTRNFTRLSLGDSFKIYAKGVGFVKEINEDGEELLLIDIQ